MLCAWNIIETVFLQEQAMNIIACLKVYDIRQETNAETLEGNRIWKKLDI